MSDGFDAAFWPVTILNLVNYPEVTAGRGLVETDPSRLAFRSTPARHGQIESCVHDLFNFPRVSPVGSTCTQLPCGSSRSSQS